MEAISRLNLEQLKPEVREELEVFTEPQFRCCLEGKDPYNILDATIVAVGSPDAGLALVSVHKEIRLAMIHSVQAKDYQEEPLRAIFEVLEKELINEGVDTAIFRFYDEGKRSNTLWNILEERKWAEPEIFMIKYFLGYTFNPPWLKKPFPYPKGFQRFQWATLRVKEKADLLKRIKRGTIPINVSPFGDDETLIEPLNSFGLRHKGKVIGWIVTHRVSHDTISYKSLYIEPEYQHTGYAMRLLADAIEINKASPVTHAVFEINIDQSPVKWIKFIERRLAPYAVDTVKMYKSWKTLRES